MVQKKRIYGIIIAICIAAAILAAGCTSQPGTTTVPTATPSGTLTPAETTAGHLWNATSSQVSEQDIKNLTLEAFVYGFPLVESMGKTYEMATSSDVPLSAPVNTFGHTSLFMDAEACPRLGIVSPNDDTLYQLAQVDAGKEPLVLHVPATGDRYYVMQFVDAWSNNFAYVGKRATGTAEGEFLLVAPGWQGEVPAGMTVIHAPTRVFTINGRFAVAGEEDVPNVEALQEQVWLTPLSRYPGKPDTSNRTIGDWPLPGPDPAVPDDLLFWEKFRVWSQAFPPDSSEAEYLEQFAPLGLCEEKSPYVDADPSLEAVLSDAQQEGLAMLNEEIPTILPLNEQWGDTRDLFNYNVHFFEIGTIDAPEWKITDPQTRYVMRGIAALIGLWGNHAYEAYCPSTYNDNEGRPLSGEYTYILHFNQTPPVEAFWSVTMYDVPQYYLVDNPLNRYSIGDRTPGVQYNDDGSLDIFIQQDSPGPDRESNWLPAPAGLFRPVLRMYMPDSDIFDGGQWQMPSIQRVEAPESDLP